jgi:SOS-response transcriptional repressor LexA
MKLHEKIREARRNLGREWTQELFAKELTKYMGLKISRSWVASVETGRTKLYPKEIEAIAKILKKPAIYFKDDDIDLSPLKSSLLIRDKESNIHVTSTKFKSYFEPIPVVGVISSPHIDIPVANVIPEEHLPIPIDPNGTACAFKIKGNFLSPLAGNGDYLIMINTNFVEDGKMALVNLQGKEIFCTVYKKKNFIELKMLAGTTEKLKYEELDVVGKVVGFFKRP